MRPPFKALFLFVSLLFASSINGYAQVYDFQNFNVDNGLSQSVLLSLYQTMDGEMWMGTNQGGVNIYNGTDFRYLTKKDGLSDNIIYCINQLPDKRVLLGTNNGLTIVHHDRIQIIGVENGLSHAGVVSIYPSSDGTVWLGTGKGLSKLVGDSAISVELHEDLSNTTIYNIREDEDGGLWFCTTTKGLFHWNGKTVSNYNSSHGMTYDYVFDVMPVGRKDQWMFDGERLLDAVIFGYGGAYLLRGDSLEEFKIPKAKVKTTYYCFERDAAGNIWIGTNNGIIKYTGLEFKHFTTKNGLVDDNIWKMVHDDEGNMWFASKSNGLSKLNSERFALYDKNTLPETNVKAFFIDSKNRKWLGTEHGAVLWENDTTIVYDYYDGFGSNEVLDIDEDRFGTLYFATSYGLTTYDGTTFRSYRSSDKALNGCLDVFVDMDTVWLGTRGGPAVFRKDTIIRAKGSEKFTNLVFDAVRKGSEVWFAYEDGLLRYDGQTFVKLDSTNGFFNGRTRSIAMSRRGTLWFGTNDGLYSWDNKKLKNINSRSGLLADAIYSLVFQNKKTLWVGQATGMTKLLLEGDSITSTIRYSKDQGYLGLGCNSNATIVDDQERVWIGTSYGVCVYDQKFDKSLYYAPKTRLVSVNLFSLEVDWTKLVDSVTVAGLPVNPRLAFDQNHLTFVFSGVSFASPASINYTYKLDGLDKEWSPLTNNDQVTYSSLAPGDYVFRVKSGYGEEVFRNEEQIFRFTIRPPFYKTTWFYLLCIAIAALLIYSYIKVQRANVLISAQNIEITEKSLEIAAQKTVIETKSKEVMDSIHYASNIQNAILPPAGLWENALPNSFVLYLPKDVVSGDFYWMYESGDDVFFAAVDCTGHGVPGALMSMIGYAGLNQAVSEHGLRKPGEILDFLTQSVNSALNKDKVHKYLNDGMDIALCKLNRATNELVFSGAYNPLLIISNGEDTTVKADRFAIGSMDSVDKRFTDHFIQLQPNDTMYVFSDGFGDQFGGEKCKKLGSRQMRELILEIQPMSMEEQRDYLGKFFHDWRGNEEQLDDVCVIGVRV